MSEHSVQEALAGLRDTGTTLIKRGTAMGPLVPVLVLVPILLAAVWIFKETAVVNEIPLISAIFAILVFIVILHFLVHYSKFAKHDPDRLQSEHFRVQMQRMQFVFAKELPEPLPAESLGEPRQNPNAVDNGTEEMKESQTEEGKEKAT